MKASSCAGGWKGPCMKVARSRVRNPATGIENSNICNFTPRTFGWHPESASQGFGIPEKCCAAHPFSAYHPSAAGQVVTGVTSSKRRRRPAQRHRRRAEAKPQHRRKRSRRLLYQPILAGAFHCQDGRHAAGQAVPIHRQNDRSGCTGSQEARCKKKTQASSGKNLPPVARQSPGRKPLAPGRFLRNPPLRINSPPRKSRL